MCLYMVWRLPPTQPNASDLTALGVAVVSERVPLLLHLRYNVFCDVFCICACPQTHELLVKVLSFMLVSFSTGFA